MIVAAVLDACVLYPIGLRDVLLDVAIELELYRPVWSATILDEMQRNLVKDQRCTSQQAAGLRTALTETFPDAEVFDYEPLIERMTNDPKDRHVLAAAVKAEAALVITSNLKDFPRAACEAQGVTALSPDDFLCRARARNPDVDLVVHEVARSYGRKGRPVTYDELISRLFGSTPRFASELLTSGYDLQIDNKT